MNFFVLIQRTNVQRMNVRTYVRTTQLKPIQTLYEISILKKQ